MQVADAARQKAGRGADAQADRSFEESDQAADRRSADGADGELVFRLLYRDRAIGVLLDYRFSVNRDASFRIELLEGMRSFIGLRFVVEDYNQHSFH